jgi:hypothetical protein
MNKVSLARGMLKQVSMTFINVPNTYGVLTDNGEQVCYAKGIRFSPKNFIFTS